MARSGTGLGIGLAGFGGAGLIIFDCFLKSNISFLSFLLSGDEGGNCLPLRFMVACMRTHHVST
ncbi:hypothetical protein Hanom_Chr15g01348551 [Helianthus anomalus]